MMYLTELIEKPSAASILQETGQLLSFEESPYGRYSSAGLAADEAIWNFKYTAQIEIFEWADTRNPKTGEWIISPTPFLVFRLNSGRGSGSQKIKIAEVPLVIAKLKETVAALHHFETYLNKISEGREITDEVYAVAEDHFLEQGGMPALVHQGSLRELPLPLPEWFSFRTQHGKGAKPSVLRVADVPELVALLEEQVKTFPANVEKAFAKYYESAFPDALARVSGEARNELA